VTWESAKPADQWKPDSKELRRFLREIHRAFAARGSLTWNPPNVGASTSVDTTLDVATYPSLQGLRPGMHVTITPPSSVTAGIMGWAWVAADDTLTIRLANVTAGAIDLGSGEWSFMGVL